MKRNIVLFPVAMAFALGVTVADAGDDAERIVERKTVIALKTDDFEVAETDISDLAVGESETIITDSGRTIDLLSTEEGVEVYVDGELLEMSFGDDAEMHGDHQVVHKRVEVTCESDAEEACEKTVWVSGGEDFDETTLHGEDGEHKVIRKTIRIECDDEEDCAEHNVWISEGEDVDIEALHEHGDAHGVVMIRKGDGDADYTTDVDIESLHEAHGEKVIVIKKKGQQD